ncbi:unnamed protein product [Auanema sp. JU1783]|nr:unnamed protein product [Auanema sp. JU1783]
MPSSTVPGGFVCCRASGAPNFKRDAIFYVPGGFVCCRASGAPNFKRDAFFYVPGGFVCCRASGAPQSDSVFLLVRTRCAVVWKEAQGSSYRKLFN